MSISKYAAIFLFCISSKVFSQQNSFRSFKMFDDVIVTIDSPLAYSNKKKTIIILYALPNGNTTEQTMGKKIKEGVDWNFDIQHIKAQSNFIRTQLKTENIIVIYLENNFKSWPLWKTKHANYVYEVQRLTDTVFTLFSSPKKVMYLNGHSGGGRFIFSYLDGVKEIPSYIERISFLDSDYGYETLYLPKIKKWLTNYSNTSLNIFAYNDSVALLDGKRFVSDTGGTWYRSFLMLRNLSDEINFTKTQDDSLIVYKSADKRIQFYFKTNPEKKIYHTVLVEKNGFIHSVLMGTKKEFKKYTYFGERAYKKFIE